VIHKKPPTSYPDMRILLSQHKMRTMKWMSRFISWLVTQSFNVSVCQPTSQPRQAKILRQNILPKSRVVCNLTSPPCQMTAETTTGFPHNFLLVSLVLCVSLSLEQTYNGVCPDWRATTHSIPSVTRSPNSSVSTPPFSVTYSHPFRIQMLALLLQDGARLT
jgi:hypothetical protein